MEVARERRAEAVRIVDAPGHEGLELLLDAVDWLGWLEFGLEEYDAALEHFAGGWTSRGAAAAAPC